MIRVGLMGYGKAGRAVAEVLLNTPGVELRWVAKRSQADAVEVVANSSVPVVSVGQMGAMGRLLAQSPVDALVDFSGPSAVLEYGEEVRRRGLVLVSAVAQYSPEQLEYLRSLGESSRVMVSSHMTMGINFLMLASRLMRVLMPQAEVEILEPHVKDRQDCQGAARKLAEVLNLAQARVTSLRLGGVVDHHEVIFGFPHQTMRLVHDTIRVEAFGTGAAYALQSLWTMPPGFYQYDDVLMHNLQASRVVPELCAA
jgi:4-hydroxy-tetrahydrodipicolinate reductase